MPPLPLPRCNYKEARWRTLARSNAASLTGSVLRLRLIVLAFAVEFPAQSCKFTTVTLGANEQSRRGLSRSHLRILSSRPTRSGSKGSSLRPRSRMMPANDVMSGHKRLRIGRYALRRTRGLIGTRVIHAFRLSFGMLSSLFLSLSLSLSLPPSLNREARLVGATDRQNAIRRCVD